MLFPIWKQEQSQKQHEEKLFSLKKKEKKEHIDDIHYIHVASIECSEWLIQFQNYHILTKEVLNLHCHFPVYAF